jgi:hypothetical protein
MNYHLWGLAWYWWALIVAGVIVVDAWIIGVFHLNHMRDGK